MMNSRTVFESKNINKTFGPTRALEDVSITLGRGEAVSYTHLVEYNPKRHDF